MLFAALMYHNEAAHFVFGLSILTASAWNGSSFYSKVWAARYMQQVLLPRVFFWRYIQRSFSALLSACMLPFPSTPAPYLVSL